MRLLFLFTTVLLVVAFACQRNSATQADDAELPVVKSSEKKETSVKASSKCKWRNDQLLYHVEQIAQHISDDSVQYNSGQLADCSGIFHRVLDSLSQRCSDQKLPSKQYRSSRDLARWYHEQGALTRIKDALASGNQIKKGMVLFYGPRRSKLDEIEVEALFQSGGINHVGIVTDVQKDSEGNVISYYLFHGLRPGKVASITKWHKREYRNRPQYPPFGNGTEQWVAMAPIILK